MFDFCAMYIVKSMQWICYSNEISRGPSQEFIEVRKEGTRNDDLCLHHGLMDYMYLSWPPTFSVLLQPFDISPHNCEIATLRENQSKMTTMKL